jgi:hypothetical protein
VCRRTRRFGLASLYTDRRKAGLGQSRMQPRRQRTRLQPDPLYHHFACLEESDECSGSLAARASRTMQPISSTTQIAVSSNDTSNPAK